MHSFKKIFLKPVVLLCLMGTVFLFYACNNRLASSQMEPTFQVIQWSEEAKELLSKPNDRRIYFHETSGKNHLNLRQTCAVESAAKKNPNRPVQLIMQANVYSANDLMRTTWLDVLSEYPNVAVFLINETDYFSNSPLEEWYTKGEWRHSPHKHEHFSDYIRMLSNLKGGGLYMDLDFITTKRLDVDNFLAVEDANVDHISNGIFHFDYGHQLINEIVEQLAAHYQPGKFNAHGPAVILSVMSKICNFKRGDPFSNECQEVGLMPSNFVYPIHWQDWNLYFEKATPNIMKWINGSFAVHVWNKMSHSEPILTDSRQVYSKLILQHCPQTFARAQSFLVL